MKNNSKEVLDKNAKAILRRILNGESLSDLQKEYGIDKKTITEYYRKIFQKDKKSLEVFDEILKKKKEKTSTKNIQKDDLYQVINLYLNNKLTLKQSAKRLHVHEQTFKKKMEAFVQGNPELLKLYKNKKAERENYKNIDFKKLVLEMLEHKSSQKEIETEYDLKPKTLSRKISKFALEEENDIYVACKILANMHMEKRELHQDEEKYINSVLRKYKTNERERE